MSLKYLVLRCGFFFAVPMVMFLVCFSARSEQSVSFGWDPSPDPSVVGYLISYGTSSGDYTYQMDVGANNSATISGLADGLTYYIVVIAYDAQYSQSAPSQEIAVTMPGLLYIQSGTNAGDPVRITFTTAPWHWYELQAATSPGAWQTIWQTPVQQGFNQLEYDDPSNSYQAMCFYRLVLH